MEARWSSKPLDGVRLPGEVLQFDCPWSVADARNSAKVEDQVRFLAGTLTTLEPDGTAIGCNPIKVGLGTDQAKLGLVTTGVSDQPTAGPNTSFKCETSELFLRWLVFSFTQLPARST